MAKTRFIKTTEEIVRENFEKQKLAEKAEQEKKEAATKPSQPKNLDTQKKEEFRIWWLQNKRSYADTKGLEDILWLHLMSAGFAEPEKFEDGVAHFGLIRN